MPYGRPSTCLLLILCLSCKPSAPPPETPSSPGESESSESERPRLPFEEGPAVDFSYYNGGTGHYYYPEIMGGGVAMIDYDFDGDLDLFLPQGHLLEPVESGEGWMAPPAAPGSRLLRLDRAGGSSVSSYRDVTDDAGILAGQYGMGVAVGDVDGNGYPDLLGLNWGRDQLWLNRGDGGFELSRELADDSWSAGATFFDLDRDGDLDLYVVRYVQYQIGDPSCLTDAGGPDYCGPLRYPGIGDRLYRNRGDGSFEDISSEAGIDGPESRGMSVVAADFDSDGWTDLFVTSDSTENHLWMNLGDGTFEDHALEAGCAMNFLGAPEASMGIAIGDFSGNGYPDLLATHLFAETNTLYLNDGNGLFRDASLASGLGSPSLDFTTFGIGLLDADHDGQLDLVTSSGLVRVPPALSGGPDPYPLGQRLQYFRGLGNGRFEEIQEAASPIDTEGVGRGLATGDWEGDGDLDVVAVASNGVLRMLENDHDAAPDWIALRTISDRHDRLLGARVALLEGDRPARYGWLHRDGSYASSSESAAHFGLPRDDRPLALEVQSLDGQAVRLEGLRAGRSYLWSPREP